MSIRAGVDTGGTFTDLVLYDEGERRDPHVEGVATPSEPSRAVFDSFAKAGLETTDISYFVHGTTVATNALIERRGADVALLTTDGFRDILRIQRVTRPNHFDLHWVKPRHFVPRARCVGVPERVLRDGSVLIPLDEAAVRGEIERLRDGGDIDAIGVSYLFSFVNPDHELRTRELIARAVARGAGLAVARGAAALARVRAHLDDGARRVPQAADAQLHVAPGAGVRRGRHRPAARSCAPTAAS